ncbi:saccharopine dehydrogenase [Arthrobacter glacialis]|nr:saccharopine dehydrogenase [Arthrobacter glacialis]
MDNDQHPASPGNDPKAPPVRVLLLGARGAVGRHLHTALAAAGHEVTRAGRTPADGWLRFDAGGSDLGELQRATQLHDVVVNASGVENPALGTALSQATLVDISASAGYLAQLRSESPQASMILGAGLAPGLSTLMAASLDKEPGDDVDVALMLGAGEKHGPAAVEWTQRLIGAPLVNPVENHPVMNLRERRTFHDGGRTRGYLRADFPDHLLLGDSSSIRVRNYFALDSPAATWALGAVARFPAARRLITMVPPMGSEDWSIVATNRRTGQTRRAWGSNQSSATGVLAARVVDALAISRPSKPVAITSVMGLDDIVTAGINLD